MKKYLSFVVGICVCLTFSLSVFSQKNSPGVFVEYDKSETVKKANKKLDAGDVSGALKILDDAIEKKEDLFEAYRTRSFIRQFYKNDIDGAILDLTKAIEIKPDDENLYISRASLKKRYKTDLKGALADYQTAQKYKPDSINLVRLIANLKFELKDFDGAVAEIQTALKTQPADIELNLSLVDLLNQKGEIDKAVLYLQDFLDTYVKKTNGKLPKVKGERVKKKIPRELQDPSGLGSTVPVRRYSQMDFYGNSWKDVEKQFAAVEEARSLSRAFITLGKLFIAKNDFDKAFKNLNTALEIDKNQEEAYGLRGILYLSKGEFEKSIAEFNNAIEIADEPYFYLNRGIAFLAVSNDKKAQSDFDEFLKLYPNGRAVLDERIAEIKQTMNQNQIKPK